MKELLTFENFNQAEYSIGDIVIVEDKGRHLAKITNIFNNKIYIVKYAKNDIFLNKEYKIREDQIKGLVKSNSEPAKSSDWLMIKYNDPSNDMVINGGYPDTPVANIMPY